MVSKLRVYLFFKCVHFYKYNATMNVYTHLSESDLLNSFEVIGRNRNFDFYSLTRIPEIVAPNDDTEE